MASRRTTMCLVLAALVMSGATATAQNGEGGGTPLSDAIRTLWQGARLNIQESAAQIPEDDYGFRPTAEVRTFGQMLAHIAGANYVSCAAARGERSPHAEDEFERTATTKAAIVEALERSLAYCDAAYDTLTDATAVELVPLPFGAGQGIRALPLMSNTTHLNGHYGNLVTYFRLRGMVPPSTRRQQ